eukprot:TRINITY_DN4291_c0_g1_i2.p1 TRINITY_DN4291_c0_g1~~TRINITY_DN4291_c0_g1_i2.p1  ORF type:complete len:1132 (-),score=299.42 TRINITY_DN4291_c0_g1_i2:188-3289(-)
MYAVPELRVLQAVLLLEDFIKKFASGEVFMLRSSYKTISIPLFSGIKESAQYFGIEDYVPGVPEPELDSLFDTLMINHIKESEQACLCLWIADKIVEEAINDVEDFASVIATTPHELPDVLSRLNFLADDKLNRFRVVIDSVDAVDAIQTIKNNPDFTLSKMPIIVNKEKVPSELLGDLGSMRSDTILSSGTIGFPNFISMSFLLVVGSIDPSLSYDFNKNGVVVITVDHPQQAYEWVIKRSFLATSKSFRILLVTAVPTGKSSEKQKLPLGAKKQCKFIRRVRQEPGFEKVPILIKVKEKSREVFAQFDHSVHNLKWVRITDNEADIVQFGFMTPLDWAKKEILYPSPALISATAQIPPLEQFVLKISRIACTDILVEKSKETALQFFVNDVKIPHKLKEKRDTAFPVWDQLDLQFELKKGDNFRIEINSDKFGPGIPESLVEFNEVIPDLCPVIFGEVPLQNTWAVSPSKIVLPHTHKDKEDPNLKKQKIRGSLTLDFLVELKSSKNPKKPKYFGKTISESTRQTEEDKCVHLVDQWMYTLLKEVTTEGLFRLPGSTKRIQELKKLVDEGQNVSFEFETVNDVCSLMKLYFVELPDSLVPSILYDRIKAVSLIEDEEERRLQVHSMTSQFPVANREMFIDLLTFLKRVSLHSEVNFMTPKNLAVCWTPTIITAEDSKKNPMTNAAQMLNDNQTTTELVAWLIENVDTIFPKKVQLTEKQFHSMQNVEQTIALTGTTIIQPPIEDTPCLIVPKAFLRSSAEQSKEASKSANTDKSFAKALEKKTKSNVESTDDAKKEKKQSGFSRLINKRQTVKPGKIVAVKQSGEEDNSNITLQEDTQKSESEDKSEKSETKSETKSDPKSDAKSEAKSEMAKNDTQEPEERKFRLITPEASPRKKIEDLELPDERSLLLKKEDKKKIISGLEAISPRSSKSSSRTPKDALSPRGSRSAKTGRSDTLDGKQPTSLEVAKATLENLYTTLTPEDKIKFKQFVSSTLGNDLETLKSLSLFLLFSHPEETAELQSFITNLAAEK